jgi:putative ABC transport system substrate-binding protein
VGEFAAHKAEQILVGGRRARDVPVETLARFAFVVRVDVARGLDVLPPITLFNYAEFR